MACVIFLLLELEESVPSHWSTRVPGFTIYTNVPGLLPQHGKDHWHLRRVRRLQLEPRVPHPKTCC